MPRRTLEEGEKPFEFRTGLGLPALGGMFRSGDPATIPPHKFHLLINMRKTPGGLITRPGLDLVFDTGIEECIDGLTEDRGAAGTLMLWPGAVENGVARNSASFRTIFLRRSTSYAEFMFVMEGSPAAAPATLSPVLEPPYSTAIWDAPPFFFKGKLCAILDLTHPVDGLRKAVVALNLPERIKTQANDCLRNTTANSGSCTEQIGLWPYGKSIGAIEVLTWIDAPFASADWDPESLGVMNERQDDALTGSIAVRESLYLLILGKNAEAGKRRVLKFDGTTWTVEYSPTDGLTTNMAMGIGIDGPFLLAHTSAFSAVRGPDGTWATGAGTANPDIVGWTESGGWTPHSLHPVGTIFRGSPAFLFSGIRPTVEGVTKNTGVFVVRKDSADNDFNTIDHVVRYVEGASDGPFDPILGYGIANDRAYVLVNATGASSYHLLVNQGTDPSDGSTYNFGSTGATPAPWLQEVGGRIYVGGRIVDWNPVAQVSDAGVTRHGVYDVTDPDNIELVYEVLATQQTTDAVADRYSKGCLPAFPEALEGVD